MKRCFALFLLGSVLGCSSAPPPKEEVFEKRNTAAQYMEFGNRYYQQSDFKQALQLYLVARNYYGSVDDVEGIVGATNAIGKTYLQLGNFQEGYDHFLRALEHAKASKQKRLILQTVNNLSEAYLQKGETGKARAVLEEHLSLVPANPPWTREDGVYYHNLAAALQGANSFQEAEQAIQRAITINRELKNFGEIGSNYYLLAVIRQKQGNFEEALTHAEMALRYDKQMENSVGIAQDLILLGFLHERMQKPTEAYDYYSRAFLVYRSLNHYPGMERALKRLEDLSEKGGKPSDARVYREAREALRTETPVR